MKPESRGAEVPEPKKPVVRGAKRMKEQGYTRVEVWLDAHEKAIICAAAERSGTKLSTYVRACAFKTATKKLRR